MLFRSGDCIYNRRDWDRIDSRYYCGNEASEYYGCPTAYDDGCEDGEED